MKKFYEMLKDIADKDKLCIYSLRKIRAFVSSIT